MSVVSSLFSVFDPGGGGGWGLGWASWWLLFLVAPRGWVSGASRAGEVCCFLLTGVSTELKVPSGGSHLLTGVALLTAGVNLAGLSPYTFTPTSHPAVSLTLALSLWGGGILWRWGSSIRTELAHLVPAGSPLGLSPFMALVEAVGLGVRPLALAIRLSANMVAGHLLLSLAGSQGAVALPALVGLGALELGVALVQGYVLTVLLALYAREG